MDLFLSCAFALLVMVFAVKQMSLAIDVLLWVSHEQGT